MAKLRNQWEAEAREMAARIDRQLEAGEQLALLPDELPAEADGGDQARGVGRPKGAKNKGSSQLRDWLSARGLRLPEDVLVEIAGLRTRDDAVTLAMKQAERILTWAYDGAHIGDGAAPKATAAMRLDMFRQQYTTILRAAEALMPYIATKASPDAVVNAAVYVNVPGAPSQPGDQARNVTPSAAVRGGRMMPADVAHQIEQNQQLSDASENENSDDGDEK